MIANFVSFVKNNLLTNSNVGIVKNMVKDEVKEISEEKITDDTVDECTKDPKWQTWFPFTFFYGGGKIQPIYSFVTIFCSLAAYMLYIKIKSGTINTSDLGVVLGFISSLILLYNRGRGKVIVNKNITDIKEKTEGDTQP